MKKTKVILLRGEENSGKTTTIHLLRATLLNSKIPACYYRLPFGNDSPDFAIVLKYNGKNIGIISHGDEPCEVKVDLEKILDIKVDIIVGCTREANRGGTYKVYKGNPRVDIILEDWTERVETALQQAVNHCEVAIRIINKIDEIIKP